MSATIKDVAEIAGVCIATVSRAFNSPDKVSSDKRDKIFKAAQKVDYHPNAFARGLITKSSMSIGIMVPDINNIFFPSVIKGIENECADHGYLTFICETYNDIEREKKYISSLQRHQIDGFVFVGARPSDDDKSKHIVALSKNNEVLLLFDRLSGGRVCSVYNDEINGSEKAVDYLFNAGNRKIALFASDEESRTNIYKYKGYKAALLQHKLSFDQRYVFNTSRYEDGGYCSMEKMFSKFNDDDRPTAVFAINDQIAIGAYRYCVEHGIKVPKEMNIIGFSGTTVMTELGIQLPTVDQQPYKIGRIAALTLIANIQHNGPRKKSIIVDTLLKLPSGYEMH